MQGWAAVKISDDASPSASTKRRPSTPDGTALSDAHRGSDAGQIENLRGQLRERDKLIEVYRHRLAEPVFLLKAAIRSLIHLMPYIFHKLLNRNCVKAPRTPRDRCHPQVRDVRGGLVSGAEPAGRGEWRRSDRALCEAGRRDRGAIPAAPSPPAAI